MFAVCGVLNLDENLHVLSLFLSNESMAIDQLSLFVSACARFTSRLGGGFKSKMMMLMALLFICSNSFLGSAQAAIGDLFNRTEIKPYAQHASSETANLPATLYNSAVVDSVVEDYEYDYVKLNRISSLPLFPRGYRAPKYLVDKVVVYKQYHQMMLYKNNQVVRKYWIALSDRPQGHKIQEGDRRTPEGTYTLDYVKENSYYYRAFHISYPNPQDIANARKRGVSPGGMIMVHGQPPSNSEYHETVQRSDWTNGCIAILNPEMDEFISLVDPGTPIEIMP
ncbi:MAG: L,D-transpeptidase family protein [Anaerobiospirillum succiniciproducens]|uniref:L,D-transpeptidase family protein n=1 Tax=Anaerobiospirillum succiniciproducens TaxID=13335 RepID=UPI0026DAF478|nr:L,D-transpeptidase family protein [Anaerobiospirillum succiniciproducens]MDO4675381.1 L,D-transpeptidase family protein [Anaerobiospirillum succiniciproducens]